MKKYVPYEKMSKKKQREENARRRVTWGTFSPVTRKPDSSRAYRRRKAQDGRDFSGSVLFLFARTDLCK